MMSLMLYSMKLHEIGIPQLFGFAERILGYCLASCARYTSNWLISCDNMDWWLVVDME